MDQIYLEEWQAAEFLKVQPDTMRKWRHKRKGPKWRKIGRRVVYLMDDLENWLRGQ